MPIAYPDTQEALTEWLEKPENLKEAFAPDNAKETLQRISRLMVTRDKSVLDEQIREQATKAASDFLAEHGYRPAEKGEVKRVPMVDAHKHNSRAPGAELDGKFATHGEFLAAAIEGLYPDKFHKAIDPRLKDLSETVGSAGGFLTPETLRTELMMLALETAVVRPRATVIPMAAPIVRIPAIRDTTHASTVFGGVSGTWIAEGGDLSSSTNQPTFTQVALEPNKLTAYTVASNELLQDSAISLEGLLAQLFPDAIGYFEDDAFINGVGAGQPLGVLNADALISQAKETGQSATTVVWENLVKMFSRMMPQSLGRAVWVINGDVFPQLATMSLNVGTGGSAIWLNNGVVGPPMAILGRPVVFTEKCQTLGTAGDIYLVDLSKYLIGDRQALTVARSEHVNFTTDEIAWRFVLRVDGRPWVQSALTPRYGSTTTSPYVALATRS